MTSSADSTERTATIPSQTRVGSPATFESLKNIDISSVLLQRAAATPDEIAFRFLKNGEDDIVEWTYSQLRLHADCVTERLRSQLTPGAKVLLVLEPGLKYIAALFGIFQAGATAVPSFPPSGSRAVARLASIYDDCKAELIIAEPGLRASVDRLNASLAPKGPSPQWMFADDDLFSDKCVITQCAHEHGAGNRSGENFPALLQYTSGSTGNPKGVILSHANLISNSHVLDIRLGASGRHIGFSWLPPYHDMGLMGALLLSVYSGFTLVIMSPAHFIQRPFRWLKALSTYKVTTSVSPNFALDLCVDAVTDEEIAELDLSNLKLLFCGAEPVRQATLDRFSEKFKSTGFSSSAFVPCYGLAEATLFISGKPDRNAKPKFLVLDQASLALGVAQPASSKSDQTIAVVSCGTVATNHKMAIVDPDTLKPLPPGVVGEIWFKGDSVAQGYLNQPASSTEIFNALIEGNPEDGSYLRTGDLGFIFDDELYVTGRIKDVIIFAGRNLYPQDIEASAQASHPAIRTNGVAAFSVNRDDTEKLVVVAEITRSAKLTSEDLENVEDAIVATVNRSHGVSPFAVHLAPVSTIPLTTSGKVRRSACREAFINGTLAYAKARSPIAQSKPVDARLLQEE